MEQFKESKTNQATSSTSTISSLSSVSIDRRLNPLAIENNTKSFDESNFASQEDEIDTSDLNHLEQKLRDAWIQMRKLDKKLADVSKREKQAKRETVALIEKNRAELELLRITTDHKESKLESENTAHFLALSYIDLDDDLERELSQPEILTPLFKTQLPDMEESSRLDSATTKNDQTKSETISSNDADTKKSSKTSSKSTRTNTTSSKTSSKNSKDKEKEKEKEKDKNFIKRNIQVFD